MSAIVTAYLFILVVVWTSIGALATAIEVVHVIRDLWRHR